MGAATNERPGSTCVPRAQGGDAVEPCRICARNGTKFSCKPSEWRAHADKVHPSPSRHSAGALPPRNAGRAGASIGGQTRQQFPGRRAEPTIAALAAFVDTLDTSVEIFALGGFVY